MLSWQFILLTGLSMSVGWGVRGQFGHEYGAALAGALGGMWFMQGVGITVAIIAVLVVIAVRRRIDMGSSLVLHLSIGWWVGFLVLVRLCGMHMSPLV